MFLISVPQREHAGEALQLHRKRARSAVLLHDPARRRRHPRFAFLVCLGLLQVAAQKRGRHLAPGAVFFSQFSQEWHRQLPAEGWLLRNARGNSAGSTGDSISLAEAGQPIHK